MGASSAAAVNGHSSDNGDGHNNKSKPFDGDLEPLVVHLPNQSTCEVAVEGKDLLQSVFDEACDELEIIDALRPFFCLAVKREGTFYEKLNLDDKASSLPSKKDNIALRKWIFNAQETALLGGNDKCKALAYGQTLDDIKENRIHISSRNASQYKTLIAQKKHDEYMSEVRKLTDYGSVTFPHCSCDSRKRGHVIVKVCYSAFKLYACTEEGQPESQVIDFVWSEMKEHEVRDGKQAFCFQYQRGEKKPRWVKIFTRYPQFMSESFQRVLTEKKWEEELLQSKPSKGNLFSEDGLPKDEPEDQEEEED